jgi:hypothetical protein
MAAVNGCGSVDNAVSAVGITVSNFTEVDTCIIMIMLILSGGAIPPLPIYLHGIVIN